MALYLTYVIIQLSRCRLPLLNAGEKQLK